MGIVSAIGTGLAAGGATALGTGAAVSAGAGLIGSGISAAGSLIGGQTQADAAKNAANVSLTEANNSNALIQQIYGENKSLLQPFVSAGTSALGTLQGLTGTNAGGNPLTSPLTAPFASTPGAQASALAATPGYQFTKSQGLLATQAGSSAIGQGSAVAGAGSGQTPGVGPSGPLGKSLANYAEGLASSTYQQQFQNYLTQNQQIYNQLSGIVGTGANAAAATAGVGATAGGQSANALLTGAGQYGSLSTAGAAASAAGTVGATTAASNGLGGIGNSALLYGVLGQGGAGGGGGATDSSGYAYTGTPASLGTSALVSGQWQ